jgi:alpha-tubulin suppressor-like RCC1 family protein
MAAHKTKVSSSIKMFDSQVVDVAAGGFHALALAEIGKVYGWGKKSKAQLGTKHRKGDIKFNTKTKRLLNSHIPSFKR